ncbi:hypothetical protein [Methylobacterium radiodurans]|uniref:hypothetical protein n=1 Tax=Methylobacterium radiodurans TaxID=2202828 RepID=UPI001FEC65D0|nr:hypothetical protein [Methylobacterium radiodurans]
MADSKQPIRGNKGATTVGPCNPAIETQNPDLFIPPESDQGGIPNLKLTFAMAHLRLEDGG